VSGDGWFADLNPEDEAAGAAAIRQGRADHPADWPALAVESGFADDEADYYDRLHAVTIRAADEAAVERSRAPDQQLVHAVRSMDECSRLANELAERVTEWAGSYLDDSGTGLEFVRALAERDPGDAVEARIVSLAREADDLLIERDELRAYLENETPTVAPNLAALAGPVLAARLIALAGNLESLAKKPSGTVQVLGAEDALFAHLEGRASAPKPGVIFTHPAIRETAPEHRGSAARALAGKLSIAARIDHYSGEHRPELQSDLDERIERIRGRSAE
jgi:nucleolar protein 56